MERTELRSDWRTIEGKQVKRLRANGLVPAVVYGPDTGSLIIQVPERALDKALQHAGSALINLFIGEESQPHAVLVRDVQRNPLTGRTQHVDFLQVRLTDRIRATIPLLFSGESPAVEGEDAALNRRLEELEVECLPDDLVDHIVVDISRLKSVQDQILVRDLNVPEKITVLDSPDEVVVGIQVVREVEVAEVEAVMEEESEEEEDED